MSIVTFIEKHFLLEVGHVPIFKDYGIVPSKIPDNCPLRLSMQYECRIYANDERTVWLFLNETDQKVKVFYTEFLRAESKWIFFTR